MAPKISISNGCPFTIHNIPFGVISTRDNEKARCASAIGDFAIDLEFYDRLGRLEHLDRLSFGPSLQQSVFSQVRQNGDAQVRAVPNVC